MKRFLNFLCNIFNSVTLRSENVSSKEEKENSPEIKEVTLLYFVPKIGKWACEFVGGAYGCYFTCWGHVDAPENMSKGDKVMAQKGQISKDDYGRWDMKAL